LLGSLVEKFLIDENGEKIILENPITLEARVMMLCQELGDFEANLISSHCDAKEVADTVEKVTKMSTLEFEEFINPEIDVQVDDNVDYDKDEHDEVVGSVYILEY
jgi:hypothetical protein